MGFPPQGGHGHGDKDIKGKCNHHNGGHRHNGNHGSSGGSNSGDSSYLNSAEYLNLGGQDDFGQFPY